MADLAEGNPAGIVARSPEAIAVASPKSIAAYCTEEAISETLRVWQEVIAEQDKELQNLRQRIEAVRTVMIEKLRDESSERNTFADGIANGLLYAVQILDGTWRNG